MGGGQEHLGPSGMLGPMLHGGAILQETLGLMPGLMVDLGPRMQNLRLHPAEVSMT